VAQKPRFGYIDEFRATDAVAKFVSVKPAQTFHPVQVEDDGRVSDICAVDDSDIWINGGFFVLRPEIFEYMRRGEDLVEAPFQRLIQDRKLRSHKHRGFWSSMDTLKDKLAFDARHAERDAPWMVWEA